MTEIEADRRRDKAVAWAVATLAAALSYALSLRWDALQLPEGLILASANPSLYRRLGVAVLHGWMAGLGTRYLLLRSTRQALLRLPGSVVVALVAVLVLLTLGAP